MLIFMVMLLLAVGNGDGNRYDDYCAVNVCIHVCNQHAFACGFGSWHFCLLISSGERFGIRRCSGCPTGPERDILEQVSAWEDECQR